MTNNVISIHLIDKKQPLTDFIEYKPDGITVGLVYKFLFDLHAKFVQIAKKHNGTLRCVVAPDPTGTYVITLSESKLESDLESGII